jgi:hypothetical protein
MLVRTFPEAKELVKAAAEKDPASDVRQAAQDIMTRNSDEFPGAPGQSTISRRWSKGNRHG